MSPDGENVYIGSVGEANVVIFDREVSGTLTNARQSTFSSPDVTSVSLDTTGDKLFSSGLYIDGFRRETNGDLSGLNGLAAAGTGHVAVSADDTWCTGFQRAAWMFAPQQTSV